VTTIQIIVLALIQGLSEFLPVSSSAHLILGSVVFGWPDQGLVFDLATHLGTLAAVFIYFRRDLTDLVLAWVRPVHEGENQRHRSMGVYLAIASIPAILAGAFLHELVEIYLREVRVIAWMTILFGLLLWWVDARCSRAREMGQMTLKRAFLIGLAQTAALVPGVSRSGVTITAGRFLGFSNDASARFSFLLSIPIIGAAGSYGLLRVATGTADINWVQFSLAVVLSALAGWLCIAAFLALLKRVGLLPFVLYRLVLGIALLWMLN
jgi:undecaprenyl-diphosphatase